MTKTSYHHGNLKNTILDEVLELLNFKNFDEISFRSISRNLGVVSSAPYNHFKDKKHLIQEVILLGEKKLFNIILLEIKKTKTPTELLLLIAKAYLKSQIASGIELPNKGTAFVSVKEKDKNPKLLDICNIIDE